MIRRILGFSLSCVLAATLVCAPGCGGGPDKKDETPAAAGGEHADAPKKDETPAAPKAPVPAVAGRWTRGSDGAVFDVQDDGTTVRGKLESDPKGTYDEFAFVLTRDGDELVGKATFKAKGGVAAETAWRLHSSGENEVVGDNEVVAVDPDTGEIADFLGRRHEKQPFTVVRPEPPKPAVEEPKKPEETPKPAVEEPKKPEETPKPAVEEPKKPEETPKPAVEEPKKPEETPKPAVEEPKKPEETPNPAVEEPKKPEETPKPAVEEPKKPEEAAKPTEQPLPPPTPTPPPAPAIPVVTRHAAVVKRTGADDVRGVVFDRGSEIVVRNASGDTIIAKADIAQMIWMPATADEAALAKDIAPPPTLPAPRWEPKAPEPKAPEPKPAEQPKAEEPKPAEMPKAEEPKPEPPKPAEQPKAEEPKPAEMPKAEEPKPEPPKPAEQPKAEEPKPAETPKAEEPKPAETPKAEEPKPAETPKAEEPKPAEQPKAEEPKPEPKKDEAKAPEPNPAPTPTPTPKADETPKPAVAKTYATPVELVGAIFDALKAGSKESLAAFTLDHDELVKSVGADKADQVQKSVAERLDGDYARFAAESPDVAKATLAATEPPSAKKLKLRNNPECVEVELVSGPVLAYEVDGVRKSVALGQLVKVGDGGWKILSLLPKR